MARHKPDHEAALMQRLLRELQRLPPPGRRRVVAYVAARIDEMPQHVPEPFGPQQLDLEEAIAQRSSPQLVA